MDKKKNENFFLKLIKIKKEIRDCVQNGRDLKDVEKNYGIRFSTPPDRPKTLFFCCLSLF